MYERIQENLFQDSVVEHKSGLVGCWDQTLYRKDWRCCMT